MPASQENPTTGSNTPAPTEESASSGSFSTSKNGTNSFGWMTFGQNDPCFQIMFGYNNPCPTDNKNVLNPATPSAVEETVTTGTA